MQPVCRLLLHLALLSFLSFSLSVEYMLYPSSGALLCNCELILCLRTFFTSLSSHALTVLHQRTSRCSIHPGLSLCHHTGVFFHLSDLNISVIFGLMRTFISSSTFTFQAVTPFPPHVHQLRHKTEGAAHKNLHLELFSEGRTSLIALSSHTFPRSVFECHI